jgi:DNA-binding GntR family transcriptional regulator
VTHSGRPGKPTPPDPEDGVSSTFPTLHVERASTVERTVEELRRAIFDGEVESGTPLRELALAESLGVSRPTVREALAVLVAEGLADRAPHRGVVVKTPEATSVRDVCRARFVLEGAGVLAWPEAAEPARDAVRRALRAYIDAVEAGDGHGHDYAELNRRHLAFHVSLVGLSGSPRLVAMAESLVTELRLALAQVDRIRRNAHDQADSHAALVRLLEEGRIEGPDGAHAFLKAHLDDAAASIIGALGLPG